MYVCRLCLSVFLFLLCFRSRYEMCPVTCLQGEYIVKFLVDGQWRLAPDWPTRIDAAGSTNNVLRID